MPTEEPVAGEVWSLGDPQGRTTRAVVLEVEPAVHASGAQPTVVLAAASGRVVRMPLRSFTLTWRFSHPATGTARRCFRDGCQNPAYFRHVVGDQVRTWCHAHIPDPENALLPGEGEDIPRNFAPCPGCGEFSELGEHVWTCNACHMVARVFESRDIEPAWSGAFQAFIDSFMRGPELIYAGRGILLGGSILQEATEERAGVVASVPIYNTTDPAWNNRWLVCAGGSQNRRNARHLGGTPSRHYPQTDDEMAAVGSTWQLDDDPDLYVVRMVLADVGRIMVAPVVSSMHTVQMSLAEFDERMRPAPLAGSRWVQMDENDNEVSVVVTAAHTRRNHTTVTYRFEDGTTESAGLFAFGTIWRHVDTPPPSDLKPAPGPESVEVPQVDYDIPAKSIWRCKNVGLALVDAYDKEHRVVRWRQPGDDSVRRMSDTRLVDRFTLEVDELPAGIQVGDLWRTPGFNSLWKVVEVDPEYKLVTITHDGVTLYAAPSHFREWQRVELRNVFERVLDESEDW